MLEIRDICKTYRAKSGVEVKALDHVSLTFPEQGMIFLLGKSGSGKSTLLNVVGGLDTFDSGELVIRGRSSRTFRRSDFDSYRNTFIGFIFQEYNILDDFSVGANIGLALELQGKRATEEEINRILKEVDLEGFGNRKPNELSGGQKQRIAIARALIKEPQIIMADEPTGALDSTTGAQVLETLKKLSREKLVIVVSHDREFAETYGDRIIELADGRVISDTTIDVGATIAADGTVSAPVPDKGMRIVSDTEISVADGYVLTAEDLAAINAYLASHKNDVTITRLSTGTAPAAPGERIHRPTGKVETKNYSKDDAKFIRSRLPMKKAAKMGLSSIKSKPIRLLFTIVLSLVAFSLFGYSATAIFYNKTEAATNSLRDMDANTVVLSLRLKQTYNTYDEFGELDYSDVGFYQNDALNDEDIAYLEQTTGVKFFPVYNGSEGIYNGVGLGSYIKDSDQFYNQMSGSVFNTEAAGITEVTEADMPALGFTLKDGIANNRMPTAPGEIAISYYHYMMFRVGGFVDYEGKSHSSPIGQKLHFNFNGGEEVVLTIVGVIDTGFRFEDYPALLWDAESDSQYRNKDISEMREALDAEVEKSFHSVLMAAEGTLDTLPKLYNNSSKEWGTYIELNVGTRQGDKNELVTWYISRAVNADQASGFDIIWADSLTDRELTRSDYVISADHFFSAMPHAFIWDVSPIEELKQKLLDAGLSNSDGFPVLLGNHLEMGPVDDKTVPEGYVLRYTYAQWLDITDQAYEERLVASLNEAYGLSLTIEEYQGLFGVWSPYLNEITENNLYQKFILHLWDEVYSNYDQYSQQLFDDPDFYRSIIEWRGLDQNEYYSLTDVLRNYPAEAQKAVMADLATYYLNNRWANSDMSKEELIFLGIDLKKEYNAFVADYFRSLTDAERTYIFRQVKYNNGGGSTSTELPHTITGIYIPRVEDSQSYDYILSPDYYDKAIRNQTEQSGGYRYETITGTHTRGKYGMAIGIKPSDAAGIEALVNMHTSEDGDFVFRIESDVMDMLDMVNEIIVVLDKVFLGVGIFFALFASLMMFNFISVSITNKKREIGILRAVGARSRDVFLIFFTEAFFIALVNFVLSTILSFAGILAINLIIRNELGFDLTLFSFDLRQILLLLAVSVAVAIISSFLPVNKIARKTPIDAMRDR